MARSHIDVSSSESDSCTLGREGQLQYPANTPSRALSSLSLTTPPSTPESNPQPPPVEDSKSRPASLYTQARGLLRPQGHEAVPLIGREREKVQILDFLVPFISNQPPSDNATSLYVSGAPGTGKTALVNNILSSSLFAKDVEGSNVSVRIIYINCMTLGAKDGFMGVWDRCMEKLGVPKEIKRGSPAKVDWNKRFNKLFWNQKRFEI